MPGETGERRLEIDGGAERERGEDDLHLQPKPSTVTYSKFSYNLDRSQFRLP